MKFYVGVQTHCLYMKRSNTGRKLVSVENCVVYGAWELAEVSKTKWGPLLVVLRYEGILKARKKKITKEKNMKKHYAIMDYIINSL